MTLDEIKQAIEDRIKELEVIVAEYAKESPTMTIFEGGALPKEANQGRDGAGRAKDDAVLTRFHATQEDIHAHQQPDRCH